MDFVCYQFAVAANKEVLLALCSTLDFEGFEELETGFLAYWPTGKDSASLEKQLAEWKQNFEFSYTKELIKSQNWNAKWEADFKPIVVGNFCGIRADFHQPLSQVKHEIVIQPKMAFGTGHHETTYMMLETMSDLDFRHKKVFDYGCGTGILAILAERLGAKSILAIDIDANAFENTLENIEKNTCSHIICRQGILADTNEKDFDIILANINRNVILDSLQSLFHKLNLTGKLIISGFLTQDQLKVQTAIDKYGFILASVKEKNNWLCYVLHKKV
ncbi:MAG TPA: 50S ribosomal protein L11 methyltransferase [Saprospiraceae bacterium]|nr:50S ribosomal protein L11 methyltransferase [Saprospiraceae bacterium]